MRLRLALLLAVLAACPCAPDDGPATTRVEGRLTPASGLAAADFDITVFTGDEATTPQPDGAWSAEVPVARAGVVFATPREGTPSAQRVAAGTGLYMTPALGRHRVTAAHAVAEEGPAALDARTTILSLVLLHPMTAHPSADVQRRQAAWLLARAAAGWKPFDDAARLWDEHLAAGTDFEQDPAFAQALAALFADVEAELPEYAPDPAVETAALGQGLWMEGLGAQSARLARGGVVASTLEEEGADEKGVSLKPGTRPNTGLDYHAVVHPADDRAFAAFADAPDFKSPNHLKALPRGPLQAASHVASSSHAGYADFVGVAIQLATSIVTSPIAPSDTVKLAGRRVYEVRFFSGGLGVGAPPAEHAFVQQHYSAEARAALLHNLAAGFVEGLALIPGAEAVLGDEAGAKVAQEALVQLVRELESLLASKGATQVEAADLYRLVFNSAKAAADKLVEASTEHQQKAGFKRFARWVKAGGKKVVKFLASVPGKVAKGGALAHRLGRLVAPESLTELWFVAVDDGGRTQRLSGSVDVDELDANGEWRIRARGHWVLEGTDPTGGPDADDPQRLEFSVPAGTPVRYEIRYEDVVIEPTQRRLEGSSNDHWLYQATEARLECQPFFSQGATHSESCAAMAGSLSATLPAPGPGGFVLASLDTALRAWGAIVHVRSSDGAELERTTGVRVQDSPVYGVEVTIEAR